MKKLITLVAMMALGISTIGCAEKKPAAPVATPPAETKGTDTAPPAETPKADAAK
jgi:predicted small lipoprotein YifL